MIRTVWRMLALALIAGPALAQGPATNSILAGLRDQPMNPVLIREIKSAIPGIPDPAQRCKLGVLYALGCLASGNAEEGLAMRTRLIKNFPHNELLQELTDDRICAPCPACEKGRILDPCLQCNGTGKCPTCKGTGQQILPGLGSTPRKVKCMYCTDNPGKCKACGGAKGFDKECPACSGTARVGSAAKAQVLYLRLLRAMAPAKETKGPVILVVTAAPPAAVAEDPEVVKQRWVTQALEAAKIQAAASPLLQSYPITAADIRAVRDPSLTAAKKEEAMAALRKKGLAQASRGQYFFLPFPAGLRYCVAEVKRNAYGGYFLKLTATPPAKKPPAEPLTPREALTETAKALCEPLGDFLADPIVQVPASDASVGGLQKGSVVTSGAWIIPVCLDGWGGIALNPGCYRSEDELLNLMDFKR
jgi:hypothetical protein